VSYLLPYPRDAEAAIEEVEYVHGSCPAAIATANAGQLAVDFVSGARARSEFCGSASEGSKTSGAGSDEVKLALLSDGQVASGREKPCAVTHVSDHRLFRAASEPFDVNAVNAEALHYSPG
jgi:hypothetical protein